MARNHVPGRAGKTVEIDRNRGARDVLSERNRFKLSVAAVENLGQATMDLGGRPAADRGLTQKALVFPSES